MTPALRSSAARLPRSLEEGLAEIAARLEAAPRVAVLLDFDGTLAPIAPTPELAVLPSATRAVLLSLSRRPGVLVAIVSGRGLGDLCERVGIPDLIYAGCHGLVIRGGGLEFAEPAAERARPALLNIAEVLSLRLKHMAGARVEDKGLTVSVHFRQVAAPDREEVARTVQAEAGRLPDLLRVRRGKEIWEISPRVEWDKGHAVHLILAHAGGRNALPVFVGDDVTDEDAFRALPEGITVKVGHATMSSAAWSVDGPEQVRSFLLWLEGRVAR